MKTYWKQFVGLVIRLKNNPFARTRLTLTILYSIIISGGIIFYLFLLNKEFSREITSMSKQVPVAYRQRFIKRTTRLSSITLFSIQPEDALMLVLTVGMSYFLAGFALRPLKKIMESQKYFLADASHELRTPLSIVKMDMEVFLQETGQNFTSKENLLEIRHQATLSNIQELERMQQMLDNLLILSRKDVYLDEIVYEQYNLHIILSQVIMRLQESAKMKSITISITGSKDISMNGDPIRMEQAILNIVKNAIKYTPKGGNIGIDVAKDTKQIKISISDNGIGIADKDLTHVFKRFFRAQSVSTQKIDGMGLGLTITKMIVEKHKGKIEIQSTLGKGTIVTIYLPQSKKAFPLTSS